MCTWPVSDFLRLGDLGEQYRIGGATDANEPTVYTGVVYLLPCLFDRTTRQVRVLLFPDETGELWPLRHNETPGFPLEADVARAAAKIGLDRVAQGRLQIVSGSWRIVRHGKAERVTIVAYHLDSDEFAGLRLPADGDVPISELWFDTEVLAMAQEPLVNVPVLKMATRLADDLRGFRR